jgi:hypothetical protein
VEQGIVEHPLDGWFGDADPEPIDLLVALYWHKLPDPTGDAIWMIGPGDNLPWKKARTGRWECPATWVETWTMTNDQELLTAVRGALITALPQDTPSDVIEAAAREVVTVLHAPWFPMAEKRIVGASNINVWALPGGKSKNKAPSGTVTTGTAVRAGVPENGWTPILFHGWVSGEMLG